MTLADLIALNDEISALVRAGVPLERGLLDVGRDLPGRLGRITTALAERMAEGASLVQALAAERDAFPPVYGAVVQAGLRSGRLSAALEGVAATVRRMAELRGVAATALLYPLIVVLVAYGLAVFFVVQIAPAVAPVYESFQAPSAAWLARLVELGPVVRYVGPAVPVAVLLLAAVWWRQSGRAALVEPRWAGRVLGWVPGAGRLVAWTQAATLADVLALLVHERVPLDEGVLLAAQASGSHALAQAARGISAGLARGQPVSDCLASAPGFPPLLCWLLATGERQGTLVRALMHAAQSYGERAQHQADVTRILLPVLLTVAIGGTATLLYALVVFLPWVSLLRSLGGA